MTRAEWLAAVAAHRAAVGPHAEARVRRRLAGEAHPVYDFLFEYYPFKPTALLRFSPGLGVTVTGVARSELDWPAAYTETGGGLALDPAAFPARRHDYLRWAVGYLAAVAGRPAFTGCFGLHEWAMVYRTPEVRHGRVPLRLGHPGTDAAVEAGTLRCTHYDAYRFFTPAAVPRNRLALTRPGAAAHDQPGCVHANMDLYKLAFKAAPFVSSAVTAAAFAVAVSARELDMRASPYDLTGHGFAPVAVETAAGREEYVAGQLAVAEAAKPVRERLQAEYRELLDRAAGGRTDSATRG